MRAKLSTAADERFEGATAPHPSDSYHQDETSRVGPRRDGGAPHHGTGGQVLTLAQTSSSTHRSQRGGRSTHAVPADLRGEGLLHDARNLVSAIGLYCDLLSMPGVLKPEHRKYPEELRLLGTRSRVLIEHLMYSLVAQNSASQNSFGQDRHGEHKPRPDQSGQVRSHAGISTQDHGMQARSIQDSQPSDPALDPAGIAARRSYDEPQNSSSRPKPGNLRATVERSLGLLSRVANDRTIEVVYGAAGDVPVRASEEAIERILVNLVRNASQALDRSEAAHPQQPAALTCFDPGLSGPDTAPLSSGFTRDTSGPATHHHPAVSSLPGGRPAIRITVGPLLGRIGEARSWPFEHVRLVVEDSGCGMNRRQLQALLSGQLTPSGSTHGIGFRVVRELVAASKGHLRAVSTPGGGTRIQIEWPVAVTPTAEVDRPPMQRHSELAASLKTPAMKVLHGTIPVPSLSPAATGERHGAY